MAVTAARISAAPTTAVPAGVTGLVAPRIGIGYSIIGMPASPSSSASSMPNRSMCSGLDRAEDDGEGRAGLELGRPAGHCLGHADQRPRLGRVLDAHDDAVLARGAHAGVELVQDAALLGRVLRGHEGRGGGEVVEALDDARRLVHVLLDALAHGAVGLAHHGGAAVGGQVRVLAVERQVELGVAAAEREGARQGRERLLDRARRDARDGRLAVHRRAVGLEHVERPVRVEHGAGLGEHVERGLVDALHLGLAEDLQRPPPPDVASVGVRGHESPFETSLSLGAAEPPPCTNSTRTYGEVTARTSAS